MFLLSTNLHAAVKQKDSQGPNVSKTPITAMGCQQCLPLGVVQLKGKHCRKPHCRNGVVDTFEHWNTLEHLSAHHTLAVLEHNTQRLQITGFRPKTTHGA